MGEGHHGRVHPDRDLGHVPGDPVVRGQPFGARGPLHDSEQLYDIAQTVGERDVDGVDRGDALARHVVSDYVAAERQSSDDGRLRRGVVSVHVRAGVPLGVAEALGLCQGLGVGRTLLRHHRQDVVRGSVDDSHDAVDAFTGERLPQRADERDRPRHSRFVKEVQAGGGGLLRQHGPVRGQQLLVARDHRLPRRQGGFDEPSSRLHPTDAARPPRPPVDRPPVLSASPVISAGGTPGLGRAGSPTATPTSSRRTPDRAAMASASSSRRATRAPPTFPQPRTATRTGASSRPPRARATTGPPSVLAIRSRYRPPTIRLGGRTADRARRSDERRRRRSGGGVRAGGTRQDGCRAAVTRRAGSGPRRSRGAPPSGHRRSRRIRPRAGAPCCSSKPWNSRTHR